MGDIFKAIGDGFNQVATAAGKELNRIGAEVVENIHKDAAQIEGGIQRGGFLGGLVEAADVFSPGHQIVNVLDATNVIPEDQALQELISGGINLGAGIAYGGPVALPLYLLAAKDVADSLGAMSRPGTPMAPSQGNVSPEVVQRMRQIQVESPAPRAPRRSSAPAVENIRGRQPAFAVELPKGAGPCCGVGGGFAPGSLGEAHGRALEKMLARIREMLDKKNAPSDDDLERTIDKILNSGMGFEDMIFALLRTLIRDTEKQGKALVNDLRGSRKEAGKTRDGMTADIKDAREKLKSETDPAKRQVLQGELEDKIAERAQFMDDSASSRAEIAEDLKNLMQKLSEMQQALSNVMNSMHESSMAAIRNIR
jgi:hypothetical protein